MFCSKCGTENEKEARFCKKCGATLKFKGIAKKEIGKRGSGLTNKKGKVNNDAPIKQEQNESYGNGCFITTACVEAKGLSDDCYELTVLRHFRDDYVALLPYGKALIDYYYKIAPLIIEGIKRAQTSKTVYNSIYKEIESIIKLINSGRKSAAIRNYQKLVLSLKEKYLK